MPKFPSYLITRLRRSFGFTMVEIVVIAMVIGVLAAIALPSFTSLYESIKVDRAIVELRASISQSQRAAIRGGEACESSALVRLEDSKSSFKSDVSSSCESASNQTIPKGVSVYSNLTATPMSEVISSQPVLIASNGSLEGLYADSSQSNQSKSKKSQNSKKNSSKENSKKSQNSKKNSSKKNSKKNSNKQKSWKKWSSSNCKDWGGCSSSALRQIGFINFEYGHQGSIDYEIQDDPASSRGMIVARWSNRPNGKMKCLAISRRIGLTRVGYYRGNISPQEMTESGQCTTEEWNKQ